MKAIILAAGRGSRLGPLTDDRPKCLTPVGGVPLIEREVSALRGAGIQEIGLVCGYKAELLKSYGTRQFINSRWSETNMVASLLCAREWLEQDTCVVSYSDIFYSSSTVQALGRAPGEIAISYDPQWLQLWSKRFKNPLEDAETFRIDSRGIVLEIGRKPQKLEEVQGQYMGLLKFEPCFWKNFKQTVPDRMDMTSFLNQLLQTGQQIHAVANLDPWGEVDSASDLAVYEPFFRKTS
jgi:choline kinase